MAIPEIRTCLAPNNSLTLEWAATFFRTKALHKSRSAEIERRYQASGIGSCVWVGGGGI